MRADRDVSSAGVSRIRCSRLCPGMAITSPHADPEAHRRASASGAVVGVERAAGRLRLAASVQLELVCDGQDRQPEVVWASLPERTREAVLVLLARLIDAGGVDEEGCDGWR